jgi:hypothetical protein
MADVVKTHFLYRLYFTTIRIFSEYCMYYRNLKTTINDVKIVHILIISGYIMSNFIFMFVWVSEYMCLILCQRVIVIYLNSWRSFPFLKLYLSGFHSSGNICSLLIFWHLLSVWEISFNSRSLLLLMMSFSMSDEIAAVVIGSSCSLLIFVGYFLYLRG